MSQPEARAQAKTGADGETAIELPDPPEVVQEHLSKVAEGWGARLEPQSWGGRLVLPMVSGLRRGVVAGVLRITTAGDGARVVFRPEEQHLEVNRPAVAFLLLALAGATMTVIWPLFPRLLPAAPLGALFALGGWFLVISRLRNSGPQEFLETLAVMGEEERAGEAAGSEGVPPAAT